MKRFHVHLAVEDLATSIAFYSRLFGERPSKQRDDYAKWMLEDPRLNFAISSRGHVAGLNHFGMQAESPEELAHLKELADAASEGRTLEQDEAACCYAKSQKHWTLDPQGIAWEHYYTMSEAMAFGGDRTTAAGACCVPLRASNASGSGAQAPCCVPNEAAHGEAPCCE